MQLLEQIARHAAEQPDVLAIRQTDAPGLNERFCTWEELHDGVTALGRRLRNCLPRGTVVLLICSNRPEFWLAYFACLYADLSVFPIPADTHPHELARIIGIATPGAAIVEAHACDPAQVHFPQITAAPELGTDMVLLTGVSVKSTQPGAGLVLQSSGTTGRPRIVWRNADALDAVARNMVHRIGFCPSDRILAGMPLAHSYGGEHGVLAPAYAGTPVHVCNGIDLSTIAREIVHAGITILPGVPFLFEILAQAPSDFPSLGNLRHAFSAGAQLPQGVYDAFISRFGVPIGQIYGATEFGTVTFNSPADPDFQPMSVGRPLPGVEIRLLDPETNLPISTPKSETANSPEFHLAIRATSMLSHLVGDSTSPFSDGFILTGDLATLSPAGTLTITGRLRLLIDVAGRKVNPIEVELTLREHPLVADCVVVPIQVSQTVSRLKAIVVPRTPATAADAQSLRDFAGQRLSAYKIPRIIEFRPSLPKTSLGKVLRHLVSES